MLNQKSKLFNKSLAVLLSTVIAGSTAFQPTYGIDTKCVVSAVKSKFSSAKEWIKNHLLISGAISMLGGAYLVPIVCKGARVAVLTINSKCGEKVYMNSFNKVFDNVSTNKYTSKQEGVGWCWIACIQGMFKNLGINVSQKEIFNKIYGTNPSLFKALRLNCMPAGSLSKKTVNSINNIHSGYKLNKCMVYMDNINNEKDGIERIKKSIKEYRKLINNNVFAIYDSFACSFFENGSALLHFVNVVDIDDNDNITIEDPQSGLSRIEKLDTFCARYYENEGLLSGFPVIEMMSIVDEKNTDAKLNSSYCYSIDQELIIDNKA